MKPTSSSTRIAPRTRASVRSRADTSASARRSITNVRVSRAGEDQNREERGQVVGGVAVPVGRQRRGQTVAHVMREPVRSRCRRRLKGAADGAQGRGGGAWRRQQRLSGKQSSPLRAVKPAGRGRRHAPKAPLSPEMTISGLTKGRVFGESQIAKSDIPRLRPERAPPQQGGFRVSGLLIS